MAQFNPIGKCAWVHPGHTLAINRASGRRSPLGRFMPVQVLAQGISLDSGQPVFLVRHLRTQRIFLARCTRVIFQQEV